MVEVRELADKDGSVDWTSVERGDEFGVVRSLSQAACSEELNFTRYESVWPLGGPSCSHKAEQAGLPVGVDR